MVSVSSGSVGSEDSDFSTEVSAMRSGIGEWTSLSFGGQGPPKFGVPNTGLKLPASVITFIFPPRQNLLMWVGRGGREVLEWPYTVGGGGVTPPWTPPPPTKVTIVGKNEKLQKGKSCQAIFGTLIFESQTSPPPPLLIHPPPGGGPLGLASPPPHPRRSLRNGLGLA